MTEHDIQNIIRLELSKLGWITFRVNVGKVKMEDGRYFDTGLPAGFSDLIAFKDGQTIFIEVKKPGGRPSKNQLNFKKRMENNGFKAIIAYDFKDVKKVI
jgi:hypothetical protein